MPRNPVAYPGARMTHKRHRVRSGKHRYAEREDGMFATCYDVLSCHDQAAPSDGGWHDQLFTHVAK
jgi:hypothetical protein